MAIKGQLEDLTGRKFGRLTALEFSHSAKGQSIWKCKCDCGNETFVSAGHLKSGHTTSCGCFARERFNKMITTHGLTGTRLQGIWFSMKQRCFNKNNPAYKHYGGRGITICDEWKNDFKAFYDWSMANGYDECLSIDRIDVNGNYEPSNCRWATTEEQGFNKRTNRLLTYDGKTQPLNMWAKETGIDRSLIQARIDRLGWSVEQALTTPVKHNNRSKKGITENV